jgi:hypothetical protein
MQRRASGNAGTRVLSVAIVFASIGAALGVGEVALRMVGSHQPPPNPIRTSRPDLYRSDPDVGYTLWPSRTMEYRYPDESTETIPLVSNSDGFRSSREFDEHDGRTRILVVGDSFVFGQGVRAEDRITEQLELLNARWRVDNMGMTGWGVDLMIRAIERFGRKADPDVVVLAVYTDDFRRVLPYYAGVGFAYPKFELVDSRMVSVPFPYPRLWERLRLVQWFYQTRWQKERNRYDLNGALLDRFLDQTDLLGFKPVVTFFPGLGDNDEDKARRGFLAKWTSTNGVPYVDLTTAIHTAGVNSVYIRDNWHWNAHGHRIAAEELSKLLRRELNDSGGA